MSEVRAKLQAALNKPLPEHHDLMRLEVFDPWEDVISGIFGSYASICDTLMIDALEAVRDKKTFEFIDTYGVAGELALYILAGHGLTEYGTSPRGAWPDPEVADLWQPLIDKWRAYYRIYWEEPTP